jgi:hypothetical protein
MSSAYCDGNVDRVLAYIPRARRTDCRGIHWKKVYAEIIRLGFDDRDHLALSDDIVELDQY